MDDLEIALTNFMTAVRRWKSEPGAGAAAAVWDRWASDLDDMVLSKGAAGWGALDDDYKSAWLGEFRRRNRLAGLASGTVVQGIAQTGVRRDVRDALRDIATHSAGLNPVALNEAPFTQYCINSKFAAQAAGSPGWLAGRTLKDCAAELRADSTLSGSLRITLHRRGGVWCCLNNRGMALHALAAVTPLRLGFRATLNTEETGRFAVDPGRYLLNFRASVPASRRDSRQFWNAFPVRTVAVLDGSPTNNQGDPVAKDVLFTIAAVGFDAGDLGNNEIFSAD